MEKKTKRRPINSVSGDTFQEPKTKKQLLSQLIKKQTKEKFLTENQKIQDELSSKNVFSE